MHSFNELREKEKINNFSYFVYTKVGEKYLYHVGIT